MKAPDPRSTAPTTRAEADRAPESASAQAGPEGPEFDAAWLEAPPPEDPLEAKTAEGAGPRAGLDEAADPRRPERSRGRKGTGPSGHRTRTSATEAAPGTSERETDRPPADLDFWAPIVPPGEPQPDTKAAAPAAPKKGPEALAAEIVARLNPEQARAVMATDGPLLILAGAGSGKTRVLAHRVAYLVGVKGVRPWQILAVTFTNKAAAEMRERIISLVGDEAGREVAMGTFHSLCARILRRDGEHIGIDRRFAVYDTDDQTQLMKQVLRDLTIAGTGETRPSAVLGTISRWKNDLLSPAEAAHQAHTYYEQIAARAFARYHERLRAANGLDFDDLLNEAVRLFEEAPDVLHRYQDRWRYLHVDEYQDTNRAQYLWARALAARHHNLAVVGDDDQSIYSWRGADLRNILDFERDYPDATVVKLEQNYRSTQLILDAAHAVVSHNEGRKEKRLWTTNPRGVRIERFEADREDEEAEWIARQVEALVNGRGARGSVLARRADDGDERLFHLRDIAVMYRTNAQSRAIEEAFLRYGLRYQLVGGTRFYQRREVKDALAYLRALRSDRDVAAFERILNVPARGLGERTVLHLRELTAAGGGDVWAAILQAIDDPVLGARAHGALSGFAELIRRLRARVGLLPLPELLDVVLEDSGYRAMLADGSEEGEERWANLLELREVVGRYADLAPEDALDRLLEETALVADQDAYDATTDAATLITLHAAKGLEFDVVFIGGMEEGIFPHSRALEDGRQMEEERRLAYVGLTRARHRLYLTHAAQRATWGRGSFSTPSRFLTEIPPELMHGPRLVVREDEDELGAADDGDLDDDQRPAEERAAGPLDLDLVLGRRGGARLFEGGRRRPVGPRVLPPGGGYVPDAAPGAPRPGEAFRPSRDLAAKRAAYYGHGQGAAARPGSPAASSAAASGSTSGSASGSGSGDQWVPASTDRPLVPGERRFRDGDRVRHRAFGEGRVVSSKLTRDDEEVVVAFPDRGVKTLLASLADLEVLSR
ncbi:MAG TPA: UvrD-helicase domain-containing protein [Candidatus Limnocylindrales bacterium]|nr:UvrD-helicase domain-containing protein [Candidatus Limnocylindrales bacterium]